ncbi:MAG: HU family DNA-binding protein [Saprospiraceae bacterium]|nr:HU family DNA-binding protein [Saprospiraceae bacterium]
MNKGEMIDAVAAAAGITKGQAGDAVNTVFDTIQKTLKKGDKAQFVGFGTFSVSKRAAREGRNPLTGKTIKIAAKNVVKFKAGTAFSTLVNKKENNPDFRIVRKKANRNNGLPFLFLIYGCKALPLLLESLFQNHIVFCQ